MEDNRSVEEEIVLIGTQETSFSIRSNFLCALICVICELKLIGYKAGADRFRSV